MFKGRASQNYAPNKNPKAKLTEILPNEYVVEVGMNSDRMAISAAQRAKAGKALGTVIVTRCKGVGRFKVSHEKKNS